MVMGLLNAIWDGKAMVFQHILDGIKNNLMRISAMIIFGQSKVNKIAAPVLIADEAIATDSKLIKGVVLGLTSSNSRLMFDRLVLEEVKRDYVLWVSKILILQQCYTPGNSYNTFKRTWPLSKWSNPGSYSAKGWASNQKQQGSLHWMIRMDGDKHHNPGLTIPWKEKSASSFENKEKFLNPVAWSSKLTRGRIKQVSGCPCKNLFTFWMGKLYSCTVNNVVPIPEYNSLQVQHYSLKGSREPVGSFCKMDI